MLDLAKNFDPSSIMMHGLNRLVRMPMNALPGSSFAEPLVICGWHRISNDMMKYAATNSIVISLMYAMRRLADSNLGIVTPNIIGNIMNHVWTIWTNNQ